MRWFIFENGAKLGPFKPDELLAKLRQGELSLDSMVTREGSSIRRRLVDVVGHLSEVPTPGTGVAPRMSDGEERTRVAMIPPSEAPVSSKSSYGDDLEKTAVSRIAVESGLSVKFELAEHLSTSEEKLNSGQNWVGVSENGSVQEKSESSKGPVFSNNSSGASFSLSLVNNEKPKKEVAVKLPHKNESMAVPEPLTHPKQNGPAPFSLGLGDFIDKAKPVGVAKAKAGSKKESAEGKSAPASSGEKARLEEKRPGPSTKKASEGETLLLELEVKPEPLKEKGRSSSGDSASQKREKVQQKFSISPRAENSVVALDLLEMTGQFPGQKEDTPRAQSGKKGGGGQRRHGREKQQRLWSDERKSAKKSRGVVRDLASVALVSACVMVVVAVLSFFLLGNARVRSNLGLNQSGYEIGQPIPITPYPVQQPAGIATPAPSLAPLSVSKPVVRLPSREVEHKKEALLNPGRKQGFSAKPLNRIVATPPKRELRSELAKSQARAEAQRDIPNGWPRPALRKGTELASQGTQIFTLQNVSVRTLPAGCAPCRVSGVLADGSRVLLVSPGSKQWSSLGTRVGDVKVTVKGKVLRRTGSETWILVQGVAQY